jgi:plasmid stabilization system protein ParE
VAYKVVWSTQANYELIEAFGYLDAFWSEKEKANLANEVDRTIELIKENPFLFQTIDKNGYRRAVNLHLNYLVYQILGNEINIVSFYPTRKKPQ